jgi:hypothetical protein
MPLKLSPTQLAFNARGDGSFKLPFLEQIDFFRQKLNLPTEHYDDIRKTAHDRAFVVAGATKADLLNDLRGAVDKAIAEGKTIDWFRKEFEAIVQKHGWEGWTGSDTKAGRDWRTRVIYKTNLSASYAAGRYAQLTDPDLLKSRPYWRYVHNDTVMHPRPLHLEWSGTVLPYNDPWWQTHFCPNGWGCRCRITAVTADEYKGLPAPDNGTYAHVDRNGVSHTIPKGIDYGWDYAPGASVQQQIRGFVDNKAAGLPPILANAFKVAIAGNLQAAHDYVLKNGVANEHKKTEFAYVYDEAGNVLIEKKGGKSHVSFTDAEMIDMSDAKGVVLVHNHPGNTSLSEADFILASKVDALIYAIGHNGIEYSGSVLDIKQFKGLYPNIDGILKRYFIALIRASKLTAAEADFFHAHLVNTALKASGAIGYDVYGMPELSPEVDSTLTRLLEHFK